MTRVCFVPLNWAVSPSLNRHRTRQQSTSRLSFPLSLSSLREGATTVDLNLGPMAKNPIYSSPAFGPTSSLLRGNSPHPDATTIAVAEYPVPADSNVRL